MAKIKVGEQEYEVPDEVASLVADETGVPYRNRAAEFRRKHEKLTQKLEERETDTSRTTTQPAQATQTRQAPYNPATYYDPVSKQYVTPEQLQYLQQTYPQYYGGTAATHGNGGGASLTADEARRIAREEAARERERDEYEREQAKLKDEWKTYEDERPELDDYLRTVGYTDDQIKEFGPRDLRLARRAWKGEPKATSASNKPPQAVILDTGGGSETEIQNDGPDWANMPRDQFWKRVNETKMKPRDE